MSNKNKTFEEMLRESQYLGEIVEWHHFYGNDEYTMAFTADDGLVRYAGKASHVVIPEGVTHICPGAFIHNHTIESVVIPDSVEVIDDYAFFLCLNLHDVSFGNNVRRVGKHAFKFCSELLVIDLPDSVEFIDESAFCGNYGIIDKLPRKLKHVGAGAFANCVWISLIEDADVYAVVPDGVTAIGEHAFDHVVLRDNIVGLHIPVSVKKIGKGAFSDIQGDEAPINTLYYAGTEQQWKAIEIDDTDDWMKNITVKFNRKRGEYDY